MENEYKVNYFLAQSGSKAGNVFAVITDEDFNEHIFERTIFGRNIKWSAVKFNHLYENCNEQNLEDIFKNLIQGQKYRHPEAYGKVYPSELVLAKSNKDFYFVLNNYGEVEVLDKKYTDDKENSVFEKTNVENTIPNIKEYLDSEFLNQYKNLENAVEECKKTKKEVSLPDWLKK